MRLPRIRAITAGVELSQSSEDEAVVERALARLLRARDRAVEAGYDVQTIRVATNAVVAALDPLERRAALHSLQRLDAVAASVGAVLSIGPILTEDRFDPDLVAWASDLICCTGRISFSVDVVSSEHRVHARAVETAAHVILALSRVERSGIANFRFAAAAGVPAGTPFFPVARHRGADCLAFGLESAGLVHPAFHGAHDVQDAQMRLGEILDSHLLPLESLGREIAAAASVQWAGIDPSPAPGMDCSIAAAIEALTRVPFGESSTLQACAAVTAAVKAVRVQTCGYAGLMLPVLEDPVLAARATEKRYGIQELLLYSAVCGTGLDVVPLPGNVGVDVLIRIVGDVAALAARLRKPLSARLLPVPDKESGDCVSFDDPLLTSCRVLDP